MKADLANNKRKRKHGGKDKATEQGSNEQKVKEFTDELRVVYHTVDKLSSLLWSHDNGLVRPKRRNQKSDSKAGTTRASRSSTRKLSTTGSEEQPSWQVDSTAQIGYGEITKGAMQKMFQILQNIDQAFKPEHEPYLKYSKEEYRLTHNDTFIDIGSGFGKPVFHAAMQVGCYSKGVEIVPARVEF